MKDGLVKDVLLIEDWDFPLPSLPECAFIIFIIHLAKSSHFTNVDFPKIKGPISLPQLPFGGPGHVRSLSYRKMPVAGFAKSLLQRMKPEDVSLAATRVGGSRILWWIYSYGNSKSILPCLRENSFFFEKVVMFEVKGASTYVLLDFRK